MLETFFCLSLRFRILCSCNQLYFQVSVFLWVSHQLATAQYLFGSTPYTAGTLFPYGLDESICKLLSVT